MDLSLYRTTELEQWITDLYQDNGIYTPADLDIDQIATMFQIDLVYYEHQPFSCNVNHVIFLNKYVQEEQLRDVFFHELCHVLRHAGDQRDMPQLFEQYQELEAGWFQMYAAVPFYMVEQLELPNTQREAVHCLATEFKVSADFAQKRLHQIQRRVMDGMMWQERIEEDKRLQQQVLGYFHRI